MPHPRLWGGQLKIFWTTESVRKRRIFLSLCLPALSLFASVVSLHAQEAPAAPKNLSDHLNEQLPPWLRLSGEYRVRFEGIGSGAFKADNDDAYVLGRARLNTTLLPVHWLKLQFQG